MDRQPTTRLVVGALRAGLSPEPRSWSAVALATTALVLYGGATLLAVVGSALITWPGPPFASAPPLRSAHWLLLASVVWLLPCMGAGALAVTAFRRAHPVHRSPPSDSRDWWYLTVGLHVPLIFGYSVVYYGCYVTGVFIPGLGAAVVTTLLYGAGVGALYGWLPVSGWPPGPRVANGSPPSMLAARIILGAFAGTAISGILPAAVLSSMLVEEPFRGAAGILGGFVYCGFVSTWILRSTVWMCSQQQRPFARARA